MKKKFSVRARARIRHAMFARGWLILAAPLLLATGNCVWCSDPQVNLSESRLNFLPQAEGTGSAPLLVVLNNAGQADLSISGISISGENKGDFAQASNCPLEPAKLAPQANCEIHVTFKPAVTGNTGTLSALLNVADNGSGSPQTVNLTGTSTLPVPMVSFFPGSAAFGSQAEGTTSGVRVIVLTNTGSAPLHANTDIAINGPAGSEFHFQAVKNSCPTGTWVLNPGASCEIGVVFAPVTIGVKNAQIVVVDDAGGSPHSVEISATGT
jgi:hypothetical protein